MGYGFAFVDLVLKWTIIYVVWVAFAILLVTRSRRLSKSLLAAVLLFVAIAGPPLMFSLKVGHGIERDKERQRRDRAELVDAEARWSSICSGAARPLVVAKARSVQSAILIRDLLEERLPTYSDFALRRPARSVLFRGSPFEVAVERIPIRSDDRLCKDMQRGHVCKEPTHAFRVWRGHFEADSGVVSWDGDLRFMLTISEPVSDVNRFILSRTYQLSEGDALLATATSNSFLAARDQGKEHCPDPEALIESMIGMVFSDEPVLGADAQVGE
ncbi:MAG: hypothetical protein HYV17_14130 [Xanthomonadales bacterium]|nr:hypothetical protein [Xanthomonadales bacterium]